MGGIGDVFVKRAKTEPLVAGINVLDVKVNTIETKIIYYVITSG